MKEIICLHVGQAGCQIGHACWELFCLEHGIQPDGSLLTNNCLNEYDQSLLTFFEDIAHKYTPRMLYIDFETTVLDEVRSGSYRQLFHPDRIITGKEDAASNYARGYFTLGQKLIDHVLEQIRRITNQCHSLQGFLIFHSFGGTGSGFTSLLMEHLNINYSKKTCFEFVIFPSPKLSTIITEPYNTVLNTHISLEYADCVFIVDNEALWDICTYSLNIQKGNFVHINRLLAHVISNITANSRFKEGNIIDFNEFLTNLVPFPRIHFPLVSYAPIQSIDKAYHEQNTTQSLTQELFHRNNQMIKVEPSNGKYMSVAIIYRGLAVPINVNRTINKLKNERKISFVDW
ncbi:unnamed protein product [Adineta steineri]|uniref:Tubulin/FtsZ GTPase domain-containing protein n=2 Tax=Adineta steineri TaxID=433720 RepID=A0A815LA09_9BILA|nr:unnamed protein product [Adineta steineri]CAF3824963.1 unnamed protein product [Adineta steineri]